MAHDDDVLLGVGLDESVESVVGGATYVRRRPEMRLTPPATAGETADGGLGDALDVVAKDLAVTLGATLSESLASFSTSGHD